VQPLSLQRSLPATSRRANGGYRIGSWFIRTLAERPVRGSVDYAVA